MDIGRTALHVIYWIVCKYLAVAVRHPAVG